MTLVLSAEQAGVLAPSNADPACIETPSPLSRQMHLNDDLDCTSLTPINIEPSPPVTPQEQTSTDAIDTTVDTTPGAEDSSEADTTASSLVTPTKKSRRRRRRGRKKLVQNPDTTVETETTIDSVVEETSKDPEPVAVTSATTTTAMVSKSPATELSELSPNPFNILLRSTKSNLNGKYNTTLLEAPLIKTIIGIPRQQILKLGINDVKIKTIISKASKLTTNILNFVQKYSDTFFSELNNQKMFFKLCIYVALYESHGFRKINADYPVLEMIGGYSEITLDTTGTKLTPSNNKVHQNNLDYAVLAYIGHILIWITFLQRQARLPLSIDNYDIELSQTTVRQHVGGVHLWSKLIRESATMNAKRWKHIYKFRQMFPFEEDQFMLIVRFMHMEGEIP